MLKLLKIEYKKIIPYSTFWVIFGLFFFFTPFFFYGLGQIKLDSFPIDFTAIYHFPEVWNNITYIASWFNLLIGMLLVILVCNEFSFKTFRQHVIDGQSKSDFILSKILLSSSFSFLTTFYLFLIVGILGFVSGSDGSFLTDIKYLLIYFVQSLGYMSLGLIIAIVIRSSALAIIMFTFSIFFESVLSYLVPDAIAQFLPLEIISNLTPVPTPKGIQVAVLVDAIPLNTSLMIAGIYILAFWGISFLTLSYKDVK
ncbi:MAG: hypothetical protein HQ474_02830 [Flammeovirgaceae bacterium]|jgi:ABC-2 type transport system permease protein|nr:hypothetical protein [Flammeovirgaceae bacterium]|tara:strand:+ start:71 stop:835 length:765 start_codon:yes stop_codon:yes gene_type:complete